MAFQTKIMQFEDVPCVIDKSLFYSWENAVMNHLDKLHNFLLGVVAAQTDAEGRVDDFRIDPHG